MIESKLLYTKTVTQNFKVTGMVGNWQDKTDKFNFGHIFSSIIVSIPPLSRQVQFSKYAALFQLNFFLCLGGDDENLGEIFP